MSKSTSNTTAFPQTVFPRKRQEIPRLRLIHRLTMQPSAGFRFQIVHSIQFEHQWHEIEQRQQPRWPHRAKQRQIMLFHTYLHTIFVEVHCQHRHRERTKSFSCILITSQNYRGTPIGKHDDQHWPPGDNPLLCMRLAIQKMCPRSLVTCLADTQTPRWTRMCT